MQVLYSSTPAVVFSARPSYMIVIYEYMNIVALLAMCRFCIATRYNIRCTMYLFQSYKDYLREIARGSAPMGPPSYHPMVCTVPACCSTFQKWWPVLTWRITSYLWWPALRDAPRLLAGSAGLGRAPSDAILSPWLCWPKRLCGRHGLLAFENNRQAISKC